MRKAIHVAGRERKVSFSWETVSHRLHLIKKERVKMERGARTSGRRVVKTKAQGRLFLLFMGSVS